MAKTPKHEFPKMGSKNDTPKNPKTGKTHIGGGYPPYPKKPQKWQKMPKNPKKWQKMGYFRKPVKTPR
jgi:hypothetical protein